MAGTLGRILCFHYGLLADDVAEELATRGFEPHWLSPNLVTAEELTAACEHLRPAFALTINWSPDLALFLSRAGVPYASWTIDPLPLSRQRVLAGTDAARCVAFGHRRAVCADLAARGLGEVRYLPLGAARRRVDAPAIAPSTTARLDASFVGSSLADEGRALSKALRSMGADAATARAFDAWLEARVSNRGGSDRVSALDPADPDAALGGAPLSALDPARLDPCLLVDAANGRLSQRWREIVIERCRRACASASPPLRFEVWGDAGWHAAAGETFRGIADHGDALTRLYATSTVNVDVPRVYQRDIVTLRVFDALAAGGLVLTEHCEDLAALFTEGEHLVTYVGLEDLAAKLVSLARAPERAATIGAAGRAHVLARHTLGARVEVILETLRARRLLGP